MPRGDTKIKDGGIFRQAVVAVMVMPVFGAENT